MGGQQSTNGTDAYKVDVFGDNMKKKFDKDAVETMRWIAASNGRLKFMIIDRAQWRELKVTSTHLCFVGTKNNFEWPLVGFRRYGQGKKVFSVELLDFNDVLNTREVIFRSKRAQLICEDFRGKLAALEEHAPAPQPETAPMIEAVS